MLNRINREKKTVEVMIKLYCKQKHNLGFLCEDCSTTLKYSLKRLDNCPYELSKPPCDNCPLHCFKSNEKEKIKEIMRYSGPKMIFRHPVLAIRHIISQKQKSNKS